METQIINKTMVESKLSCSAVAKVRHSDCEHIALEISDGNTYYTYFLEGVLEIPPLCLVKSWKMKVYVLKK